MRSFGETPGKREALLNKLVKLQETPVKREETPEKGEEPSFLRESIFCILFFFIFRNYFFSQIFIAHTVQVRYPFTD